MAKHRQIVLNKRPGKGSIKDDTFRLETVETPGPSDLKDGQILVRVLELGIEPAMRGWLNDLRSYLPPVGISEVMRSSTTAVVEASKSSKFAKGDFVVCGAGWTEYAILPEKGTKKLRLSQGITTGDFLGPLGMTGQTAYWGLHDVGKIQKGDVVLVSGAAGAVGSTACQIAINRGCRVFGIAGSKDKCDWLLSFGCEGALNYKDSDFKKNLKKLPYLNVFFDNVGGSQLDIALTHLAQGARIVLCGSISAYNELQPIKNYLTIISQRAVMQGFIVFDYAKRFSEAEEAMASWIREGKLQRRETRVKGIEAAPDALKGLFEGQNTGKMIVELHSADQATARL